MPLRLAPGPSHAKSGKRARYDPVMSRASWSVSPPPIPNTGARSYSVTTRLGRSSRAVVANRDQGEITADGGAAEGGATDVLVERPREGPPARELLGGRGASPSTVVSLGDRTARAVFWRGSCGPSR